MNIHGITTGPHKHSPSVRLVASSPLGQMAGAYQALLNLTSPVAGAPPFRSRKHTFTTPHLSFSGNRSFGATRSNSLLPRELRSVTRTLVIRNSANPAQVFSFLMLFLIHLIFRFISFTYRGF